MVLLFACLCPRAPVLSVPVVTFLAFPWHRSVGMLCMLITGGAGMMVWGRGEGKEVVGEGRRGAGHVMPPPSAASDTREHSWI